MITKDIILPGVPFSHINHKDRCEVVKELVEIWTPEDWVPGVCYTGDNGNTYVRPLDSFLEKFDIPEFDIFIKHYRSKMSELDFMDYFHHHYSDLTPLYNLTINSFEEFGKIIYDKLYKLI